MIWMTRMMRNTKKNMVSSSVLLALKKKLFRLGVWYDRLDIGLFLALCLLLYACFVVFAVGSVVV